MHSVPTTTKVVSGNPVHGKVYLMGPVLDTTLCDKVCQLLATGHWFSTGSPLFSNNKTGRHDIIEILLKVALNTINQTNQLQKENYNYLTVL